MIPKEEMPSRGYVYAAIVLFCCCAFNTATTHSEILCAINAVFAGFNFAFMMIWDFQWIRDCQRADFRAHLRHLRNGGR